MRDEPDYYELLQVSPKAEPGAIHAAYRKLARKYHPDVNPDPAAHERMRELNRALEILSDPAWRAEYDRGRRGFLAQPSAAAKPPIFIFPPSPQEGHAIGVWKSLGRPPVAWLVITGGLAIIVVAMAMIAMQLTSDSGGPSHPRGESRALAASARPANSVRAEGLPPLASPPAQAGGAPLATPTPLASPPPTVSTTPTPAAVAVAPNSAPAPAPAPNPPPAPAPPAPTPTPAPPPTPPPAGCSGVGAPSVSENGNQVHFGYGAVVGFQAGQPGVMVVDVAGTVLALAITDGTGVQGELDAATVVNGQGRRARDGSITAQQVEVVCPESAR